MTDHNSAARKRFPWKSNFLKVPPKVRADLANLTNDLIAVAAVKKVKVAEIQAGRYAHIGLRVSADGAITASGPHQPPANSGKWSWRNAHGWDRKRTDWPMVTKTYVFETPNFGDAATYGTHMHVMEREVYQHQVFEAQWMEIEPTILSDSGRDEVLVKFEVCRLLSKTQPEFDLMLLWTLNLLQENTGVCGVFGSDATKADFLRTIQLDWDIFPPGTLDEVLKWFIGKPTAASRRPDLEEVVRERAAAFQALKPEAYIRGSGQFGSYFGAKYADDLVVFENLQYGNALYILYENWDEAAKRSRLDLLRDNGAKFDRVIHSEDWQHRLKELIRTELAARRRGRGRHA